MSVVIIYKLYNENDCYIGSTKHSLHKRLSQHKSPHNRCCSKFIIESGNYKIEKIDEVDADERFKKEQQFINELSTCHGGRHLNTTIHTTTKSYIISFLISYMLLLGFHWKMWVVSCIAFVMVFWVWFL